MSAIAFVDGNGSIKYTDADGTGTSLDPYKPIQKIASTSDPQPVKFNEAQDVKFGGIPWSVKTFFGTGTPDLIIKNSPGQLMAFYVYNKATSSVFIQFFDAVTNPGSGVVPKESFLVRNADIQRFGSSDLGQGINFSNGIVIGISSTEANYTAANYSNVTWSIRYK